MVHGRADSVGTLPWIGETRGVLRTRDRVRLVAQGVLMELRTAHPRLRRKLGLGTSGLARFDPSALEVPDSAACREAEELCAASPEVIVNHSFRSYAWAAILAAHDRLAYDAEVVYVASLLHDIGFAEPQTTAGSDPCCFTVPGVEAALAVGARAGWAPERREAAAEAISLHLNVLVGHEHGASAYLVYAGARLDATGDRHWDIAPEAIAAVLGRYPRAGLKRAFVEMMAKQSRGTPGTRADFYTRFLGVNRRIRHAPFDE